MFRPTLAIAALMLSCTVHAEEPKTDTPPVTPPTSPETKPGETPTPAPEAPKAATGKLVRMPEDLKKMVEESLVFLGKKDVSKFLQKAITQKKIRKMADGRRYEDVVDGFEQHNMATMTLCFALANEHKNVVMNAEGTLARFSMEPLLVQDPSIPKYLYFQKIEDRWYLRD